MDKNSSMANDGKGHKGQVLNDERVVGEVEHLKKAFESLLVAGLAEIFVKKPTNPVEYLGHWLLQQCNAGDKGQEGQAVERAVQTRSTQQPDLQDAETPMSRNPFLIEFVIEMMLEEAKVNTLKDLREMNSNWNQLDLKELGKRAVENQLKQLDFADEGLQEELDKFLKDTVANPQLFRSFRLNFPVPLKSIDFNFFVKYVPIFLQIKINGKIKTEGAIKYLESFLSWAAPTIQELWVTPDFRYWLNKEPIIPPNEPAQFGDQLVFHKLTKIIWNVDEEYIHFKSILEKSETVNPTPVLTTLGFEDVSDFKKMIGRKLTTTALSQWSQLTKLTIMDLWNFKRIGPTLLSLGQAGMRLKEMTLDLIESEERQWPKVCMNFSQFLITQAKSLEILRIHWDFSNVERRAGVYAAKIQLPTFETLHTLQFYLDYCTVYPHVDQMFRIIQVPVQIPKLDHLSINQKSFQNIFLPDGEPIPLKSLSILDDPYKLESWNCKFPSVESLTCKGKFFGGQMELPWKESLKVLELDGVCYPLIVSNLTNLRKIIVREWSFLNKFETYLVCFQQGLTLKLSSITFKSCEEPSDYIKARYIRHFPFPVKFEPMPFYDTDDHFPFRYI